LIILFLVPLAERKKSTDYIAELLRLDNAGRRRHPRKYKTGSSCSDVSQVSTGSSSSGASTSTSTSACSSSSSDLNRYAKLGLSGTRGILRIGIIGIGVGSFSVLEGAYNVCLVRALNKPIKQMTNLTIFRS